MPRRPLKIRRVLSELALVFVAMAVFAMAAAPARLAAQERPAGAVTVLALLGNERAAADASGASGATERADYGGGAIVDLYHQTGVLRFGGALGLGAVSSADGVRSRVYLPLAASLSALLPVAGASRLDLRLRAGLWAGATDSGLDADLFGSFGGWLTYAIGGGASISVGLDVWLQRAEVQPGSRSLELYFSPGVGLVWTPPAELEAGGAPVSHGDTIEDD